VYSLLKIKRSFYFRPYSYSHSIQFYIFNALDVFYFFLFCEYKSYVTIIKPIWTFGIQLALVSKSNIEIIQRCQNVALRTIVSAYRYDRNDTVHRDMIVVSVQVEITKFARKHDLRLDQHTNPATVRLLDNSQDIRRLKPRSKRL